jgi:hypothetical protein
VVGPSGPPPTVEAVDTVALVATLGGFAVGLAGVLSNVAIAWIKRGQDVELAEKQHAHERELARGSRLYERRAPVYERMMGVVLPVMEHVEARNPIISWSSDPPLPPEPSLDEQRDIQIQLRTHGSKEVGDSFQEWFGKVRLFSLNASTLERIRDQAESQQVVDAMEKMEAARVEAREATDTLSRLVSDELAGF